MKIIQEAQPKTCILTHFGTRMLNGDPDAEVAYLEAETSIPVVAARDGMKAHISDNITLFSLRKSDPPKTIDA